MRRRVDREPLHLCGIGRPAASTPRRLNRPVGSTIAVGWMRPYWSPAPVGLASAPIGWLGSSASTAVTSVPVSVTPPMSSVRPSGKLTAACCLRCCPFGRRSVAYVP